MKRAAFALVALLAGGPTAAGDEPDACAECAVSSPTGDEGPEGVRLPARPSVAPEPVNPSPPQVVVPVRWRPRTPPDSMLFTLDVGPVYSHVIARSFGSARMDIGVGGDLRIPLSLAGRLGFEFGGTQSGLPFQRFSWGMLVAAPIGSRVRLGAELRGGVLFIDRQSEPSEFLFGGSFGLHGELSVALYNPGLHGDRRRAGRGGALDLVARLGYDWIDARGRDGVTASVAAKLALGYRY